MLKRQLDLTSSSTRSSPVPGPSLARQDLSRLANDWLLDGQFRLHSLNTVETRRIFIKNLLWFLERRSFEQCGTTELKHFFIYLSHGHEEPGGRWGNPQLRKPLRPISVKDYFVNFSSLFDWIVSEGYLEASPLQGLPIPKVRASQIQPLSDAHVTALLEAARKTRSPKRDTAILLLLLDCGLRASELCNLKMNDLDVEVRRCYVLGRATSIAASSSDAIWLKRSGNTCARSDANPTNWCFTRSGVTKRRRR